MKRTIAPEDQDQADITMRFRLALLGATTPEKFDEAFAAWTEQVETCFDRSLESVMTEGGFCTQDQWNKAVALILEKPFSIFAEKANLDIGMCAALDHLGFCDPMHFNQGYGEWTTVLGDCPDLTLVEVLVRDGHCTLAQWEAAAALLKTTRTGQDMKAFMAGKAGLDSDILAAAMPYGVVVTDIAVMVVAGTATIPAANRAILERYIAVHRRVPADPAYPGPPLVDIVGVDVLLRHEPNALSARLIGKQSASLSQLQAFPDCGKMLLAGVAINNLAVALVAGAVAEELAAAASGLIETGRGVEAFNDNLGMQLLDHLPEVGSEVFAK